MWWRENGGRPVRILALALVFAAAGLTAGCFQPLYGDRSVAGGPGLRQALSSVEILPIEAPNGSPEARLGTEVRNALIFDLTGGGGTVSPTHRLKIQLSSRREQVIVDITTARPDIENYGIDASYALTEIATDRTVVKGRTFSRVSFDIPGQQQRFAKQRGLRDAENRAAVVIADHIKSRLASFFVTGG